MSRKELKALVLGTLLMCVGIVLLAAIFRVIGLADDGSVQLPEPEATSPEEIILERGLAPELTRAGLNTYTTYDEAYTEALTGVDPALAELGGRLIWGEAGCVADSNNRRAALWCAINRAESWGGTLEQRILEPHQFHGVEIRGEVPERFVAEAAEILALWAMSEDGWIVPRLPLRFVHFQAGADGMHNVFSTKYGGGEYWNGQEGFTHVYTLEVDE